MITIKLDVNVTSDRKILIELPPEVRSGPHQILLIVDEKEGSVTGQEQRLQDFSGKIDWPVDGLLYQQQMRDEWK
jgi:hypothetical protein